MRSFSCCLPNSSVVVIVVVQAVVLASRTLARQHALLLGGSVVALHMLFVLYLHFAYAHLYQGMPSSLVLLVCCLLRLWDTVCLWPLREKRASALLFVLSGVPNVRSQKDKFVVIRAFTVTICSLLF